MSIKILMFGDIMGRIGRQAVDKILPKLKKEYKPDLIIANAENIAHGKGITERTINELIKSGVDFFTSGDHIWDKKEVIPLLENKDSTIARPANYPRPSCGPEYKIAEVGTKKILIISLVGRVFMKADLDCPFKRFDDILEEVKREKLNAIFIDFHSEATSEIRAFGFYADGKASAVIGTHTHVPTADEQILENGTAYLSDVGMVGAKNSVLGLNKDDIIRNFLTQMKGDCELPESGEAIVNAVFLEIDSNNKKAKKIERINRVVKI